MKKTARKVIAAFLALAITAGSLPMALASDTLPYLGESARGENQPFQHGYRAEDFLDWSPETDPYSEYLRARIPLQDRNAALAATQANPELSPETEWFTLAGDYGNAFFDSYPYTNEFSQYLFNFWQYTDYYGSWHGMPTEEVPEEMYQDERGVSDAWQYRKFEFGLVNMPNPGYTNAAHKNGVLSIGCIFLPRTGLKHTVFLTQDENGNFPYAEKLIEMCEYYGFDGWFINQEETIPAGDVDLYKGFMKQMRDAGLYIQWYDSVVDPSGRVSYQNEFNSANSPFVVEDGVQYSDSIFLNYWWNNNKLTSSANHAVSLGVDPLDVVFAGIEAGGDRWSQRYDLRNNIGEDGQPMNSIASLGSEFVHDGLDEDLDNGANDNIAMRREKDEFQWMTFERERSWWSGPFQDPSQASYTADRSTYPQNAEVGIGTRENQDFDGVAAYITERSVIDGDTFVTSFNTGHGLEYRLDGEVSNSDEWSNIIIQDILPTWQWWIDTEGQKLNVDFDYGPEYKKNYDNGKEDVLGNEGSFDFDLVGAYQGGSSLVVYGAVDAENFLHLYKTDLDVAEGTKVDLTFKKTSQDNVAMQLGVIFEDDTDTVVKLDVPNSVETSGGWVTSTVDLSAYAGKKVAAMGLVFNGESADYQMNIGKLAYTTGEAQKPETPTGFTIDKAYDTNEMYVSWDMASYDEVKQYNIYAMKDGKEIYLGGTYDEVFYIKDLEDAIADSTGTVISDVTVTPGNVKAEAGTTVSFDAVVSGATQTAGEVQLVLKAVSEDGTESDGAIATHNYNEGVSNIEVTAEDGKLNVTWEGGQADVVVTKEYSTDDRTWTASGNNGCTVEVPTGAEADYARYTMTITTPSGVVTTYDGRMDDSYCKPYTGKVAANGTLEVPLAKDWYQMVYKTVTNGVESAEKTITRYNNNMPNVSAADTVMVKLIDYRGNESEWAVTGDGLAVTADTSAYNGSTVELNATYMGQAVAAADCQWSIQSADETALSEGTVIENGVLTIAADEASSAIRVTVSYQEETASTSVKVLYPLTLSASSGTALQGGEVTFTASYQAEAVENTSVTWAVEGAASVDTVVENGVLTVGRDESASAVTVKASYEADGNTWTVSKEVMIQENIGENLAAVVIAASGSPASNNEVPEKAVDGDDSTKWCVDKAESGWIVLDLQNVYTISSWRTVHGEYSDKDAGFNTEKFALEVLKDSNATADDLANNEYLANNDNWTQVDLVDNTNGDQIAPYTAENAGECVRSLSEAVTGRYFRVRIDDSTKNQWTAIRLHEVQLFEADDAQALTMATMPQANAAPKSDEISQEVIWTVEGATSKNTTIDQNGNLKIAAGEQAEVLTVRATSKEDPSVSGVSYVTVTSSKSLLRSTYEYALTLSTEGVVDSAVKYFEDAKAAAKAVLDDPDATAEEIAAAWDNLLNGIWGLGITQGDKTTLEQLIAKADEMVANESKYLKDNWQQLVDALEAAKTVMDDGDALDEDIQPVAEALLEAILAQRFKADKANLEELIAKAESIDLSKYTAESVAVFRAAFKAANAVLADESLSEYDQAVVDKAVSDLEAAIENLSANTDDTTDPDDSNDGNDTSKPDDGKDDTSADQDDNKAEAPATGDSTMLLAAAMTLLAAGGAVLVLRKKRYGRM